MIIAAALLAAGMEVSGALELLIGSMLHAVRSTFGLIAATMSAGLMMIGLTNHGGVTALLICYGGPIFSLLIATLYRRTGFGIRRLPTVESATPDRSPAPPVAAG